MSIGIKGIFKQFGATPVLRGIDLDIADGELIALLGASGSGKTTLLRILAGLDWPNAGAVTVEGTNWLELEAQKRQVGFVFQHYALFQHMTVFENVAFGLRVKSKAERPAEAEIRGRVEELLELVQIKDLGSRYPAQLSGGQRQRVALARALAIRPRVLLLDEPFGALDATIRRDLRRWLRELHEQLGMTTIFVTHDQEEAFELADRVVVMGEGRIEQIGTPDEIYDHPANPFVARFLGGINEVAAELHNGRLSVSGADTSAIERIAAGDGALQLFVRPHEIDLALDPHSLARVLSVSSNGPSFRLEISLPGQAKALSVEIGREALRGRALKRGDAVKPIFLRGRIFASARPLPVSGRPAAALQAAPKH